LSKLVEHARRELKLCGQYDEDPEYAESIIKAVEGFTSFGHSGGSASVAIDQLTRLLRHENLASLTDDPAEWTDRTAESGRPLWQNNRNSKAFSEDGGQTYTLLGHTLTFHSVPAGSPPGRGTTWHKDMWPEAEDNLPI
jgi:hypothetical protein